MLFRIVRFALAGLAAALTYVAAGLALEALGAPPAVSGAGAFLLSAGVSFALQRGWTFGDSGPVHQAMGRFLAVQAMNLLIAAWAHAALSAALPSLQRYALVAVLLCVTNYLLFRGWVFRQSLAQRN